MLEDAELAGDVRPTEVTAFVLTVIKGAVMQTKSYRSIEPFDASVRQLRRYLESLQEKSLDLVESAGSRGR